MWVSVPTGNEDGPPQHFGKKKSVPEISGTLVSFNFALLVQAEAAPPLAAVAATATMEPGTSETASGEAASVETATASEGPAAGTAA